MSGEGASDRTAARSAIIAAASAALEARNDGFDEYEFRVTADRFEVRLHTSTDYHVAHVFTWTELEAFRVPIIMVHDEMVRLVQRLDDFVQRHAERHAG